MWKPNDCRAGLWLALLLVWPAGAWAIQPGGIFGPGMVLQHGRPVPVWGYARPGQQVTVHFAGRQASARADARGYWQVSLGPLAPSAAGRTMRIVGGGQTVEIDQVRVGQVWLYVGNDGALGFYHGRYEKRSRMGNYYSILPYVQQDRAGVGPPLIGCFSPVPRHADHRHAVRPQRHLDQPNGWQVYRTDQWQRFPAFVYFFGRRLWQARRIPVAVLTVPAQPMEQMSPPEGFRQVPALADLAAEVCRWDPSTPTGRRAYREALEQVEQWLARTTERLEAGSTRLADFSQVPRMPGPPADRPGPTTYYNGSIHPMAPFAVAGMIFKTLQLNMGDAHYIDYAQAMILGLRGAMASPEAPAAFFQFRPPMYWEQRQQPDPSVWTALRAVQQQVGRVERTSVLAAHDFVHDPRDPRNWAERAARWALAVADESAVTTGPTYRRHEVHGREVVVFFDRVGKGLMAGKKEQGQPVVPASEPDKPGGFELAGPDGRWHQAKAVIRGRQVVLSSDAVAAPQAVRYAWSARPERANLYNRDGFAALPFHRHP